MHVSAILLCLLVLLFLVVLMILFVCMPSNLQLLWLVVFVKFFEWLCPPLERFSLSFDSKYVAYIKPNTLENSCLSQVVIMQSKIPCEALWWLQPSRDECLCWHLSLSPFAQCQDSTLHGSAHLDWRKVRSDLDLVHLCPPQPWAEFFLFLLVWLEYWHGMCCIITEHILVLYWSPLFQTLIQ